MWLHGFMHRVTNKPCTQRSSVIEHRLNRIEAHLDALKRVVGTNVLLTIVIFEIVFRLWSQIGDISGQLAQIVARMHP